MFLDSHGEQPQSPPSKMITLPVPVVALGHAPLLYALLTAFFFFFNIYFKIFIYLYQVCVAVSGFFFF